MEPEGPIGDCSLPLPLYGWGAEAPSGADGFPNWDGAGLVGSMAPRLPAGSGNVADAQATHCHLTVVSVRLWASGLTARSLAFPHL